MYIHAYICIVYVHRPSCVVPNVLYRSMADQCIVISNILSVIGRYSVPEIWHITEWSVYLRFCFSLDMDEVGFMCIYIYSTYSREWFFFQTYFFQS